MFKKIIIVCLITFYSMLAYGREVYTLKCEAKRLAETDVELLDFYGNENNFIQSIIIDSDGSFQFLALGVFCPGEIREIREIRVSCLKKQLLSFKRREEYAGFYNRS